VTWEKHRYTAEACRDAVRKAKAHLLFSLARDMKSNKKGFYKYSSN